MHDKTQRINVTPVSTQDFEMVKTLADMYGSTWSQIGARALNEWLKENFVTEVNRYKETQYLLNKEKVSAPNSLADFDLQIDEFSQPLYIGENK